MRGLRCVGSRAGGCSRDTRPAWGPPAAGGPAPWPRPLLVCGRPRGDGGVTVTSLPLISLSCLGSQRFGPHSRAGKQASRRSSPQSCGLAGQAGASRRPAGGEALWPQAQSWGPRRGLGGWPVRSHRVLAGGLLSKGTFRGTCRAYATATKPSGGCAPSSVSPEMCQARQACRLCSHSEGGRGTRGGQLTLSGV